MPADPVAPVAPALPAFLTSPLFGVAATVVAYAFARAAQARVKWLHALLTTCVLLIGMLLITRVPYDAYKPGGDLVSFFLGPATVALAVPLVRHADRIRAHLVPVLAAVAVGSVVGIVSVLALALLTRASDLLTRSLVSKSVSTPISVELTRTVNGSTAVAAALTALAGLVGAIIGPALLRRCGVRHDIALGIAIGTSAHGIGTARLVQENDTQAGASALAMALTGIITAVMFVPLKWYLG